MKHLPNINSPQDFRHFSVEELETLCMELREYIPKVTQDKPAHIAASLAVTELSVALHFLMGTPNDVLIWDVGHQAYVHKVLTGRREVFGKNRLLDGPSGFPMRKESVYDAFGTGHSSTSISALGGMYTAAKLQGIEKKFVAVIGDGALTGGQAFEALNHLGAINADVLVVLNDNKSSIDANVGALHAKNSYAAFFSALNFHYSGDINGNDLRQLLAALEKGLKGTGPRVIHISTQKPKINVLKAQQKNLPLQEVFGKTLVALGEAQPTITAITPAMLSGCSMDIFARHFPNRTFDTGITEQHAVTFAAGQAAAGLRPFVNLYSTFAQRAYDQIIHDVALQQLPVVFCIERAGLVGEDGPTHHGAFDISFLSAIPNLEIFAPKDGNELRGIMQYCATANGPTVIRYPKSNSEPIDWDAPPKKVSPMQTLHLGTKVLVLSTGFISQRIDAVIKAHHLDIAHCHIAQIKPLPAKALEEMANKFQVVVTFEENTIVGGFGAAIAQVLAPLKIPVHTYGLPDKFVPHGPVAMLEEQLQLDANSMLQKLKDLL